MRSGTSQECSLLTTLIQHKNTKGSGRMMNWEIGIDIYTLICIKWITDKNLLYKKINKIKFKNLKKNRWKMNIKDYA